MSLCENACFHSPPQNEDGQDYWIPPAYMVADPKSEYVWVSSRHPNDLTKKSQLTTTSPHDHFDKPGFVHWLMTTEGSNGAYYPIYIYTHIYDIPMSQP